MHGVKITFFTQQAGRAEDSAIAHGQRDTPEPSSQSPEHDTPPLNSRRRRSRRRAQAYYANKATSRAGTTGAMQIVEDGDNARSTSGAAQATATPPGVFVFGAGSPPLGTAACTFDGAGTERASAIAAPRVDAGTSGGDRSRYAAVRPAGAAGHAAEVEVAAARNERPQRRARAMRLSLFRGFALPAP